MGILELHCKVYFNSLSISKICIESIGTFPQIKSLSFFFIVDTKQYKKNVILFYIMISLLFGGSLFLKKKEIKNFLVVNLRISKQHLVLFLQNYVNVYLPGLGNLPTAVKNGFLVSTSVINSNCVYRVFYSELAVIPELDSFYMKSEIVHNYVSNYRMQLDIYFDNLLFLKDSGEFLLRLYRLPCLLKTKESFLN